MEEPEPGGNSILVVDNRQTRRQTLVTLLSRAGYRVQTAASGQEALEHVRRSRPDLILLAAHMPGLDGYEVCRRLLADERLEAVPILLLEPEDRARVFAVGGADYLLAPWPEEEVLARVDTHLALGTMRRQLAEADAQRQQAVHERSQLEEVLREGEATGRDLIENLSEVIYAVDREGILTYVSPAIEPFTGYRTSEVMGQPLAAFIHDGDREQLRLDAQRVLSGQRAASEYRLVTKSGEIRWMRTSTQPVLEQGLVVGMQGVLADVTERRRAEEQIREQNEFLNRVLESLTHPFYVIDADDYTVRVANAAARMGAQEGRATCYALTHGRQGPCPAADHPCPLEAIKRTKKPVTVEHVHYDAEGNQRYVEVHGYPLFDADGNVARIIEYTLDITDRKRTQQALEKLTYDLGERVKELNCLYGISRLANRDDLSLEEIFQETVQLLPPAFQYPDVTCARILREDQEFRTANFQETDWKLAADLRIQGQCVGSVEVYYLEERPEEVEGPFLREERDLVDAVADRSGRIADRMWAEQALRQSERRYRDLLENLQEGIWVIDQDARTTYVNPRMAEMLGYKVDEMQGRHLYDFMDERGVAITERNLKRREQGIREQHDFEFLRRDGTRIYTALETAPLYDDGGNYVGAIAGITDLTQRRQMEEALRKSEALLQETQRMAQVGGWELDVDTHRVVWTDEVYRIHELPLDFEPQLGTALNFYAPEDRPVLEAAIERAVETGEPWDLELRFVTARGRPLWVRAIGKAEHQNGHVVKLSGTFQDITDRRQAEEALRDSEARWRSVAQNSPDHVLLLDTDLQITFANYASPGLTVEELLGTHLYDYVLEEQRAAVKRILEEVLATARPASYETEYAAPDGSTIYYESQVVPRVVDDRVIGLALNARDITQHKLAQEALREAKNAAEAARREEQERRLEAEQRRKIAESLARVLAALNSLQPLDQVLDHIAAQAVRLLDNQAVAICRLSGEPGVPVVQAARGLPAQCIPGAELPLGQGALSRAIASRQPVVVPDLSVTASGQDDPVPCWPNAYRALLAVPIVVKDEVHGGILLFYTEPRDFTPEEVDLAAVFGDQVALAVENARLREQVEQAAVTAERLRLGRDLHDSVTQALFSASLVAEVLPQVWRRDPQEGLEGVEELRQLTRSALAEMRTLLLELRPTSLLQTRLDDLLRQLAEATSSRAQVAVVAEAEPAPALPPDVHVAFYRVAQEALNNAIKHAEAGQVIVSLAASPPIAPGQSGAWRGQVCLRVRDDGRGFDPGQVGPERLGLCIMQERAENAGARLTVDSQPGRGTEITLVWRQAQ